MTFEDIVRRLADLLAECGYRVKAFADADSAIEFAMSQSFAVGLFDYRLGSLKNGLDVVEKMQALGCKSTYVMITADVEQATQMRAVHLKLFEFMRKPVHEWTKAHALHAARQQQPSRDYGRCRLRHPAVLPCAVRRLEPCGPARRFRGRRRPTRCGTRLRRTPCTARWGVPGCTRARRGDTRPGWPFPAG